MGVLLGTQSTNEIIVSLSREYNALLRHINGSSHPGLMIVRASIMGHHTDNYINVIMKPGMEKKRILATHYNSITMSYGTAHHFTLGLRKRPFTEK